MPSAVDLLEDGVLVGRTVWGDDVYCLESRLFTLTEEWVEGLGNRWVVSETTPGSMRR